MNNNYQTDKIRASLHFELHSQKRFGIIKPGSIIIKARLKNYCDENLECWCKMNITSSVVGNITIPNFYNQDTSFDLQPFSNGNGWFGIIQHCLKDKSLYKECKKRATKPAMKDLLYFNSQFSYNVYKSKEVIENVPYKMYYDFYRNRLIADY